VLTRTAVALEPGGREVVGVSYTGTGEIAWTATPDVGWLTVSPTSGTLRGETDVLTLQAQRGNLAPGAHQGRVIVRAGGGQAVISVTLRVTERD
jgi:hypothetical protein